MKTNRSENSHGLIRNIVYFKDKDDQVVNSKLVSRVTLTEKLVVARKKSSTQLSAKEIAKAKSRFIQLKKCSFKF